MHVGRCQSFVTDNSVRGGRQPLGTMHNDTRPITLLIDKLAGLVTPSGGGPVRGPDMWHLDQFAPAAIAISGDQIVAAGDRDQVRAHPDITPATSIIDGTGLFAIPGLIDCHTHPVFLGHRAAEFELRALGASYEQIHAAGGGILSTVSATRSADQTALVQATALNLTSMFQHGTLTAEVKSGYGLDRETELRSLRAAVQAASTSPIEISLTFLGAHMKPAEFADADTYLDFLIAEVVPEAAHLADAADIFVERGGFSVASARRYLSACAEAGLALRIHGDQFSEIGAIPLAIELGARSIDHLEATGLDGVRQLAASDVTAVLLPIASLFLRRPYPPARALIEAGAIVALATDFNPGSAFSTSLPLAMSLACTQMGMSPAEALVACTANAAHVLGRGDRLGRLRAGYQADILLLDVPDWRFVAYRLGDQPIAFRVKSGHLVSSVHDRASALPGT